MLLNIKSNFWKSVRNFLDKMRSDLICCYYILEKRGKLHRYIKLKTTSQRETSGSPVPLPPNGAAATSKSLLRIRNRAIHSPLRLHPIEHHLLPPPCEVPHDPGQHFVQHPTPLQSAGSLVSTHWQSLHGHLFCRWCNTTTIIINLFLSSHYFSKMFPGGE